ncbi:MAG: CPBP family intramembrane metalloprotease [Candidatus Omnitrophica bacterium]|nr:CPBP family intramembrane metalloprotease [Candidatus Omnitrophota bacterium]
MAVLVTIFVGVALRMRGEAGRPLERPPAPALARSVDDPWGKPLDRAKVVATLRRRPGLALVLGLWSGLALALGVGGLVIGLSVATRRRLPSIFAGPPRALPVWQVGELVRMLFLVAFLVVLLPFIHVGVSAWGSMQLFDEHLWTLIAMLLLEGWFVLVVWAFAASRSTGLPRLLGISRRGAAHAIRQGIVGYAAIFPWVFGLLWVVVRLCQAIGIEPPVEEIHRLLFEQHGGPVLGLTLLLACVVGPIVEELLFRGLLFAALRSRVSRWMAILISGALFAAVHTNVVGFLPIMALGCFLAALYERTGSLLSPIAVHVVHNTLLVGIGLCIKELL